MRRSIAHWEACHWNAAHVTSNPLPQILQRFEIVDDIDVSAC